MVKHKLGELLQNFQIIVFLHCIIDIVYAPLVGYFPVIILYHLMKIMKSCINNEDLDMLREPGMSLVFLLL